MSRFDLLSRAPNLFGTISSIISRQKAAEDQAMFDGWRNGNVTDEQILAHIEMRISESEGPIRDQWMETYRETQFRIAEAKILTQFYDGEIDEYDVYRFYKNAADQSLSSVNRAQMLSSAQAYLRSAINEELRDIINAWQNGTKYQGQFVDDTRFLSLLGDLAEKARQANDSELQQQVEDVLARYQVTLQQQEIDRLYRTGKISGSEAARRIRELANTVGGDLRNQLLTLATTYEMNDKELTAQLMYDAWRVGGKYKGQYVTDSMLLRAIEEARDMYSPDNPNWTRWDSFRAQVDFQARESEVIMKFKQGKISASAVANFYKQEMSKYPKDSEIYRQLAQSAAAWAQHAVSRGLAAAQRAKAEAQAKQVEKILQPYTNSIAMINMLTEAAKAEGLLAGNRSIIDVLNESRFIALVNELVPGGYEAFVSLLQSGAQSINDAVRYASSTGNKQLLNQVQKLQEDVLPAFIAIQTLDERQAYFARRDRFNAAMAAAKGNPYLEQAAINSYVNDLLDLYESVKDNKNVQPEFLGALLNEIMTLVSNGSTPARFTVSDLYRGFTTDLRLTSSDAENINKIAADLANTWNTLGVQISVSRTSDGNAVVTMNTTPGVGVLMYDAQNDIYRAIKAELVPPEAHTYIEVFRSPTDPDSTLTATVYSSEETPIYGFAVKDPTNPEEIGQAFQKTVSPPSKKEQNPAAQIGYRLTTPSGYVWAIKDPLTNQFIYFDHDPFRLYMLNGTARVDTITDPKGATYVPIQFIDQGPNLLSLEFMSVGSVLPFDRTVIPEVRLRETQNFLATLQASGLGDSPLAMRAQSNISMYADEIREGYLHRPMIVGGQPVTVHPSGAVLGTRARAVGITSVAQIYPNLFTYKPPEPPKGVTKPFSAVDLHPGMRGEYAAYTGAQAAIAAAKQFTPTQYVTPAVSQGRQFFEQSHTQMPTGPAASTLAPLPAPTPAAPGQPVPRQQFTTPTTPSPAQLPTGAYQFTQPSVSYPSSAPPFTQYYTPPTLSAPKPPTYTPPTIPTISYTYQLGRLGEIPSLQTSIGLSVPSFPSGGGGGRSTGSRVL
jgi:hypothetical protein